jgi:hypothetical protein
MSAAEASRQSMAAGNKKSIAPPPPFLPSSIRSSLLPSFSYLPSFTLPSFPGLFLPPFWEIWKGETAVRHFPFCLTNFPSFLYIFLALVPKISPSLPRPPSYLCFL